MNNGRVVKLTEEQARALRRFADGSNAENVAEYHRGIGRDYFLWFEQVGLIGWRGSRLRLVHAGVVALALAEGKPVPLTDAQRLALERARDATDAKVPFFAPSETRERAS